jgi:hypothetical protein
MSWDVRTRKQKTIKNFDGYWVCTSDYKNYAHIIGLSVDVANSTEYVVHLQKNNKTVHVISAFHFKTPQEIDCLSKEMGDFSWKSFNEIFIIKNNIVTKFYTSKEANRIWKLGQL